MKNNSCWKSFVIIWLHYVYNNYNRLTDLIVLFLDAGVGYAACVTLFLITIYYNVINAWSIYYMFASMRSSLPWSDCQNDWNTDGEFISQKKLDVFLLIWKWPFKPQ